MRYKAALLLILLSLIVAHRAHAQSSCPVITVSMASPDPFSPLKFKAHVSGVEPTAKLTFNWSVSTGEITGGQGSELITVDLKRTTRQILSVNVVVNGMPDGCPNEASEPFRVIDGPVAIKKEEYSRISFTDEKARLLRFARELRKYPGAGAYLVSYTRRGAWAGEARWRARRARRYLIKSGVHPALITIIDGGDREAQTIELFIVR